MRTAALLALIALPAAAQNSVTPEKAASMKADLTGQIDSMKKQAQVMVDNVFSFGELGFQEFETSKYLTTLLEKEGFKIERGVAGIPTAFLVNTKGVIAWIGHPMELEDKQIEAALGIKSTAAK